MVISRTNVATVGSVFNDTRKVKVLSLPETIKEKSTFRAKALRRELVGGGGGGRGKPRVFLYGLEALCPIDPCFFRQEHVRVGKNSGWTPAWVL